MTDAASVLRSKQLFVFDLDGTVYLGNRVFPEAVRFVRALRASGKTVLFFTNNTSLAHADYMEKLRSMGFEPQPAELMTAGDVAIAGILREKPQARVFVLGTPALQQSVRAAGITCCDGTPGCCDLVLSGFDTTLTYEKLLRACRCIAVGAAFWTTHPDRNCPAEDGPMPDCGAINAAITASTDAVPRCFGKPEPAVADAILTRFGVTKEAVLLLGDRLYTDIALGRTCGIDTALLLTGETTADMVRTAPPASRPDFVFRSLDELLARLEQTGGLQSDHTAE